MPPAARNALITAKGNENIVWLNLIKSSIEVIFFSKAEKLMLTFCDLFIVTSKDNLDIPCSKQAGTGFSKND